MASPIENLPEFSPDRSFIIYIVCSAKSRFSTSVKYASDGLHDIYVFSKIPAFFLYLRSLLPLLAKLPNVRLILIHQDTSVLVDVVELLLEISTPDLILKQKEQYSVKFREYLLKLSGASHDTDTDSRADFHATIPIGHADLTSAFRVAIVQNGDDIDEFNYLTEKHIFTQQTLRFVALKLGARFGVVSGFDTLVNNTSAMISLATRLFPDGPGAENFIYTPEGVPVAPDISVHQYIPEGWDSWSKIVLVAKSVPKYSYFHKVLSSEVQIGELNDAYDVLFEDNEEGDERLGENGNPKTLQSQTGNVNESVEGERIDKAKKARIDSILNLLSFESPKISVKVVQDAPFSYSEFLKDLEEKSPERSE